MHHKNMNFILERCALMVQGRNENFVEDRMPQILQFLCWVNILLLLVQYNISAKCMFPRYKQVTFLQQC